MSTDAADACRRRLRLAAVASPWARARAASSFDSAALDQLAAAVTGAVDGGRIPGAVVRVECEGEVWQQAFGRKALLPSAEPLNEATVYDVASLTKVMATTPVVMRLVEGGALNLDMPVRRIVPAFESGDAIAVRHLLTHCSGLPAGLPLAGDWQGPDAALALAYTRTPTHGPDTFFRYSDVNFILLGEIARRAGGRPLEAMSAEWVFGPLGMADTGYLPLRRHGAARIAPTEIAGDQPLRGEVHDPTARRMGGVAGHAGVFSTAADVARYASMLLYGGTLGGVRVLQEATVALMTQVASPPALPVRRGLGWDIDSPYSRARGRRFPIGSFGHTGFTGCVLWINPGTRSLHVFLSNRVHPVARASIVALYEEVGTRVAQALGVPLLRAG